MARCEKRTVTPEPPPEEFVLTLSKTEAYTLASLLFDAFRWDGREPSLTLKGICEALEEQGVEGCELGEMCEAPESLKFRDDFDPEGWRKSA